MDLLDYSEEEANEETENYNHEMADNENEEMNEETYTTQRMFRKYNDINEATDIENVNDHKQLYNVAFADKYNF